MSKLIWSPEALIDVQRIYRFLAPKNMASGKRAIKAIREGVSVLAQKPNIGRPIENMEEEFRDWIIDFGDSGYVVRYRLNFDTIIILTLRHQKEVGF